MTKVGNEILFHAISRDFHFYMRWVLKLIFQLCCPAFSISCSQRASWTTNGALDSSNQGTTRSNSLSLDSVIDTWTLSSIDYRRSLETVGLWRASIDRKASVAVCGIRWSVGGQIRENDWPKSRTWKARFMSKLYRWCRYIHTRKLLTESK